jgi:hypothetical protein
MAVSAPVLAQTQTLAVPTPVPPANSATSKSDLDKVECRQEDTIGSRLQSKKVCMTKQQWFAYEQEAKQKLHEMQDIGFVASH